MIVRIIAHEQRHAEWVAKYRLNLGPRDWVFVYDKRDIAGLARGSDIVIVNAPHYIANQGQRDRRSSLIMTIQARNMKVKRVSLK